MPAQTVPDQMKKCVLPLGIDCGLVEERVGTDYCILAGPDTEDHSACRSQLLTEYARLSLQGCTVQVVQYQSNPLMVHLKMSTHSSFVVVAVGPVDKNQS